MTTRPLAVVLASADLLRLYTGLSLLVSARAEGREVSALATFGALAPLLDPELEARALDARATPGLTPGGPGDLRPLARGAARPRPRRRPRVRGRGGDHGGGGRGAGRGEVRRPASCATRATPSWWSC